MINYNRTINSHEMFKISLVIKRLPFDIHKFDQKQTGFSFEDDDEMSVFHNGGHLILSPRKGSKCNSEERVYDDEVLSKLRWYMPILSSCHAGFVFITMLCPCCKKLCFVGKGKQILNFSPQLWG